MNQYRRDAVDAIHPDLGNILRLIQYVDPFNSSETFRCEEFINKFIRQESELAQLSLDNISYIGRERYGDFIKTCLFSGRKCNESHFSRFSSDIGYCFQFNSVRQDPLFQAVSTGTRAGLYVAININQSQYIGSSSFDAGVKVVVHTQNEPPRPDDTGVGVPPGTNAFIGVRQRNTIDNTQRNCIPRVDTSRFNFVGDGRTANNDNNDYTFASCRFDCLFTAIAEVCNCVYERTVDEDYQHLSLCTLQHICCVSQQQTIDS